MPSDLNSNQTLSDLNKKINDSLEQIGYSTLTQKLNDSNEKYSTYDSNDKKYRNFIDSNGNYNGSVNYREPMMNMNTVDEMLNDTDLLLLQQKYLNIFWGILAIGSIVFTITNLKK